MLKGFRQFMMRGNVVDLAVAVVMGAAFNGVITALVRDIITPLVAAIFGSRDFPAFVFQLHGSKFPVGDLLNAVLSFLLMGATVYFLVVVPVNTITTHLHRGGNPADPTTKKCPECLSEVPIAARRCAHCTSPLTAA
jgi:large conductance mechanosensitive channel